MQLWSPGETTIVSIVLLLTRGPLLFVAESITMCILYFHSSLSSVEAPDIYFKLKLPQDVINSGKLSSLQLESVVYACQQHMNILSDGTRAGFLVGMWVMFLVSGESLITLWVYR